MKLKVNVLTKGDMCLPQVIEKGDWIDLRTAEEVAFIAPHAKCLHRKKQDGTVVERYREVVFDYKIIPLGVAMRLPEGFEAVVVPRSSLYKKYGLLQANSLGVIDNTYNGDNDVWGFPAVATRSVTIPKDERICQFRIQPSQKATVWQKLKWLFSDGIELVHTDSLSDENRGGFGSTGYLDNKTELITTDDEETD